MAPPPRSPALLVVVAVVGLEALVLVGVALYFLAGVVRGGAADAVSAAIIAVMAALAGGFLGLCARALGRRQRWARGPIVCWQVLQLLTAVTSWSDEWVVPAVLVAVSLVAGLGVVSPQVTRETTATHDPPVV